MELEAARVGTSVRVQLDYGEPPLQGALGTIQNRYGVPEYTAFEVLFPDGRTKLFWEHQLEEAKETPPTSSGGGSSGSLTRRGLRLCLLTPQYPKDSPWRYNDITSEAALLMNEARNELDGSSSTRKQAEKVKTQAREIVELLEEARKLMAEDNVVQPAMKHLHTALYEAKSRATVLEDWYQRTYSPVVEGVHVAR